MFRKLLVAISAPFVFVASASAQTGTEVTAALNAFSDAQAGVTAIAAVMLGVVAAGIAVKWILGFLIS